MKYFLNTEFLEGTQRYRKSFLEALFATKIHTLPTIDLISIGIVAEDGREYYAISKDFNLKEAWNRFDKVINKQYPLGPAYDKIYWIRENVLKPIWIELSLLKNPEYSKNDIKIVWNELSNRGRYVRMQLLISLYGKTNKQIAKEVKEFVYSKEDVLYNHEDCKTNHIGEVRSNIQFYGYYCDYDWVVFCWLFGRMIDLPKGFPMYCNDLKQVLDEKCMLWAKSVKSIRLMNFNEQLDYLKKQKDYPKQTNEHNALADAIFCRDLHKFLNNLI